MISYEEIFKQAQQLPAHERLQLADALLAEELGYGMWRDRDDLEDVESAVERVRESARRTQEGRLKTPAEFLRETEDFDE